MTKVLTNKEFSKKLERRTLKFGIDIIRLSTTLPSTSEGRVIKNKIKNQELQLVQIIGKQTVQEVRLILRIKSKFVKVKPVKPNIGSK